jgi:hypothetical protein
VNVERRHAAIGAAVVVGIAVRLWFVVTTFGTNDGTFMTLWAALAERYGIAGAYAHHPLLNHPPLALWLLRGLARMGDVRDRLRLMQIVADIISFGCLLRLTKDRWPALVFFLSPVAIFISGFHCNTDSTMVCLILVAAVLIDRSPLAAGVVLALATGIKIVPLLLVPLFLIAARRRWWQTLAGFCVTFAAIFAPVLQNRIALTNIFGYAGQAWWWGWPALAARLEHALPLAGKLAVLHLRYGRFVVAFTVIAIAALYLKKNGSLLAAIALTFVAMLFVSTGAAVQYLVWPLPFLPFLYKRWETLTVHAAMAAFMAAMYTVWSRGWPWTYADSLRLPWPHFEQLVLAGFIVWALLGCAIAIGALRMRNGVESAAFLRPPL